MTNLAILGSTGSIGVQTLQLVREHRDKFNVRALTAMCNAELLAEQAREFCPDFVGVTDGNAAKRFYEISGITPCSGENAIIEACGLEEVDTVLVAVVGVAGLPAVLECIKHKKKIALANKEALVTGGKLVNKQLEENEMRIFPVDSEHSAIFQCLEGGQKPKKLILTASGGPFRNSSIEEMEKATVQKALSHPKWNMGKKISIDSATMMNKGLEVIEAHWLFNMPPEKIEVIFHPQSIIHSMVEFEDCSVLAQMGNPDMRIPILYALCYPQRFYTGTRSLSLAGIGSLTFEEPDYDKFPCLSLAYLALEMGGTAAVVLNAANEIAVERFLQNKIGLLDISRIVEDALNNIEFIAEPNLDDIFGIDSAARQYVLNMVQ